MYNCIHLLRETSLLAYFEERKKMQTINNDNYENLRVLKPFTSNLRIECNDSGSDESETDSLDGEKV